MQVNVELKGIEELAEQLRYIEQNIVNKALHKTLVEQVKPLKQGMKQRAPKFTGELRQKISHKGIVKKNFAIAYAGIARKKVSAPVLQRALAMEFGNTHVAPRAFVTPVVEQDQAEIQKELMAFFDKHLDNLLES